MRWRAWERLSVQSLSRLRRVIVFLALARTRSCWLGGRRGEFRVVQSLRSARSVWESTRVDQRWGLCLFLRFFLTASVAYKAWHVAWIRMRSPEDSVGTGMDRKAERVANYQRQIRAQPLRCELVPSKLSFYPLIRYRGSSSQGRTFCQRSVIPESVPPPYIPMAVKEKSGISLGLKRGHVSSVLCLTGRLLRHH